MTNNTTDAVFPPTIDYLYGSICLVCFLIGVPGNAFSFFCFVSQGRSPSSRIYACITVVDFLNCLNALTVAITYLALRRDIVFGNEVYCNMWGISHRLLSSLCIFYVAVLSISRTFVLIKPFKKLNTFWIELTLGIYFLIQVFLATIPFWEPRTKYAYHKAYATCETPNHSEENRFEEFSNILSRISYFGPTIPILLSCAVSVGLLMLWNRNQIENEQKRTKRYASITIVIFTLIFATFNIPGTIISIFELGEKIIAVDPMGYSLNFFYYLSIPLNSTLNPILYMIRMHSIKEALRATTSYIFHNGPNPLKQFLRSSSRTARSIRSAKINRACTRMELLDGDDVEAVRAQFKARPTSYTLNRVMKQEYQVLKHQKSCQL